MEQINYRKEAENWLKDYDLENSSYNFEEGFADFAKHCLQKTLPIILNKVADKAKAIDNTYSMGGWGMKGGSVSVSKESITSLEQEILKELL